MQSRRQFLANSARTIGTFGLAAASTVGCAPKPRHPLNIILVTIDTLAKKHLGCHGYQRNTSPNLDAFAEKSLRFENFFSNGIYTVPTHTSILTGLHPRSNRTLSHYPVPRDNVMLAETLSQHGYETAAFTSVAFLNPHMIGKGFQTFSHPQTQAARLSENTLALAKDHLSKSSNKPQFVWIHLWDVHHPYAPNAPFREQFFDKPEDAQRLHKLLHQDKSMLLVEHDQLTSHKFQDPEDQRLIISQYDGELAYTDSEIGKFNTFLERSGYMDDTILMYTADHGENLFENSPYWLQHFHSYQPVVDIPLLVRHPDYSAKTVAGLTQNIDLFPSITAWCGIDYRGPLDGKSLAPAIQHGERLRETIFITETDAQVFSATDGQRKIRRLLREREPAIAVPEAWKREVQKLPRITIVSGSPGLQEYAKTNDTIAFSWAAPESLKDDIAEFRCELMRRNYSGPYTHSTAKGITREGVQGTYIDARRSPISWQKDSYLADAPIRIVARNRTGNIIATSEVFIREYLPRNPINEFFDLAQDPEEARNLFDPNTPSGEFAALDNQLRDFAEETFETLGLAAGNTADTSPLTEEEQGVLDDVGYL